MHIIDYLFISTFIYIYTSPHNINLFTISSNNSSSFILDIYFISIFGNDSCNFLKNLFAYSISPFSLSGISFSLSYPFSHLTLYMNIERKNKVVQFFCQIYFKRLKKL